MSNDPIVIVGAGHSGARAAHALRKLPWQGPLTVLGNEGRLPYDRPPLSKAVLLDKRTVEQCELYPASFYEEQQISLDVHATVARIDRERHVVVLADGREVPYAKLLLATGGEVRRLQLPGAEFSGVHYLRTPSEALALKQRLGAGQRLVVVGAGFIGLEVAAAAAELGCGVDVIESAPRALVRALPAGIAEAVVAMHREHGVRFHFNSKLTAVEGNGVVGGVTLADGTMIACDTVCAGIGVTPRTELAEAAGLEVDNGIAVDEELRTSDPDIYAIGDACSFASRLFGRRLRLESWKNAEEQAKVVARNLTGQHDHYTEVPWFWSNQYDKAIQVAGVPELGTQSVARRLPNSWVEIALDQENRIVGASGFGVMREIAGDIREAMALVAQQAVLDPARLADSTIKLGQ